MSEPMSSTRGGEPLMIKFASAITGNVYDEMTVDHMADMVLILYTGGGTAIGTIVGACIGSLIFDQSPTFINAFVIVPLFGFLGAFLGAVGVLKFLNARGLLQWDRYEIKRTYRLKQKP